MRRANVVSGIVLAVFGLVMLLVVIPWQIEPGPADMVSPRLVPQMMMVAVTALSLLLVVTNLRAAAGETDTPSPISRAEILALARIGAVFALAVGLYLFVSPLVAGAALVVGALVVLGERRPVMLIAMPAGLLLAIWFLFYRVLGTAIV